MKRLLSMFLLSLVLVLSACGNDEPEKEAPKAEEEKPEKEIQKDDPAEEEPEEEQEEVEKSAEDVSTEEDSSWDDVKEMDKIIGKSDKDFSEITKSKPNEVRNDTTGKWRILKISENIDIEEYALSYADLHMKNDEAHFIVNFNYHTTTWLNELGGLLYVEVREYEEKEEHDANKLGNGMILKSYVIYPDGDIQELDE